MDINKKPYDLNKSYVELNTVLHSARDYNIAIDIGSTQTRLMEFDGESLDFDNILALDSPYAVLEEDLSNVPSKSDSLYDNMEFVIEDITENKEVTDKVLTEPMRIIKGGLLYDTQKSSTGTNSNQGKIEQEPTYVNTIISLALNAYIKNNSKILPDKYHVPALVISLPPKDTQSVKRTEDFKRKLAGTYTITMPRLSASITIVLKYDKILLEDENNAVLRFWNTFYDVDISENGASVVIDGGGSSIDFGVLKNGRLVNKFSRSLAFGGNRLSDYIVEEYVAKTGKIQPKENQIKLAVEKGYIKMGKRKESMKPFVHTAKMRLAKEIMAEMDNLFDSSNLDPEEIENVVCSGGMFKVSDTGAEYATPSLERYLSKMFESKNKYTEFSLVDTEYPIPYGLALFKVSQG